MPQDNWWGNLKVEHNVTSCIPFSLILNLKDCCLVFYCTSYASAEFITIVQASLSNGQSTQCNKSFSAHWDYFTFFPFFSCNFFSFQQPLHNVRPFHPFPFLLDVPPTPQPWGFTQTLKCIIRMKPGARQPKAIDLTGRSPASSQGENRPEEEEADVEFPVLTFWEVMDTNSLVHVAEFSRHIFKEWKIKFQWQCCQESDFSIFPDVQINFTALKGFIWNRFEDLQMF